MRNFINTVTSAHAPRVKLNESQADVVAEVSRLTARYATTPFHLTYSTKLLQQINTKLTSMLEQLERDNARYDPEERETLNVHDVLFEDLIPNAIWYNNIHTFGMVRAECRTMELAYQKQMGDMMDDEAGFRHDMHYVESSDYLTCLEMQIRYASRFADLEINGLPAITEATETLKSFLQDWDEIKQPGQDTELVLAEAMRDGLEALIPLLKYAANKSA